jgi:hypothetical protein
VHAAALHRVHFGLLPISCYFGSMGQQNRSPEVIDAEFEIVRPADRGDEYVEPRHRFEVVWPLSRFVWFCLIAGAVVALVFVAGGYANADADRACVLIFEATKTHADISVPDFCRSRLTHPDGYQPR